MVITFPSTLTLVSMIEWAELRRDLAFNSLFSSQSIGVSDPLWKVMLSPARFSRAEYAEWEMLVLSLKGRQNQLALWHLDRPVPRGTMRGAMVMNGAHAAGVGALNISSAGEAGKTLLAGDHLGFGSGTTQQVVKVKAAATADGSGNITVQVYPELRNAFVTTTPITWDKPKALFRRTSSESAMKHERNSVAGTSLDLIEDWRA